MTSDVARIDSTVHSYLRRLEEKGLFRRDH